jgi:hypothetical protein
MISKTLKTGFVVLIIIVSFKFLPSKQKISINKRFYNIVDIEPDNKPTIDTNALRLKSKEALTFCKSNQLNQKFCVLIDMNIHSGLKRFFVWSFENDSLMDAFLVSHGCGDNAWGSDDSKDNVVFSNLFDSHCTSKGKYRIGERGISNWGVKVKYLMHGLESSNNNALKRFIVFHSWDAVSNEDIYPLGTVEGWGCPAISNQNFLKLDSILQNTKPSILMWIY